MMGISKMVAVSSPYYVDCAELACARGMDPKHATEGLGMKSMTVLYDGKLEGLGIEALERLGVSDVELILVATESAEDLAKPIGAKIVDGLGLRNVGTVEMKFACLSSAYSVMFACERARSVLKPVAVLCLDEALYDSDGTSEFTQGAGAVAMKLEPAAGLTLDFSNPGYCTIDVDDFYKPRQRSTPIVDGKLSIISYLYALKVAVEDWKAKNRVRSALDHVRYLAFHLPFPRMAEWAFAYLYAHERLPSPRTYHIEDVRRDPSVYDAWRDERKHVVALPEFKAEFERKVLPSIDLCSQVGNWYTGSIWLSLQSLIMKRARGIIGMGAYGSGAGSMAFRAFMNEDVEFECEGPRERLSVEEYLRWRASRGLG